MKVNGIDIKRYNATQLTVDLQPPQVAVPSEWVEGAVTPWEFNTNITFGTLAVRILFRGKGRSEIQREISEMLANMTGRCEIQLDGYKGTYIGDITSNRVEKTKVKDRYIWNLAFNGYMIDDEVLHTYDGVTEMRIVPLGTRDTPCVLEITPTTDIQELRVSGFGSEDIIISNMTKDTTVTIDGINGIVVENGENKFADCDMWEFPVLKKGKENNIKMSTVHCKVKIRYTPMWL